MRCQKCGAENPDGAKFCIQCASALARHCAKCGFDNPAQARFCAQCASPLEASAAPPAAIERIESPAGERRHLTVLFCDLVGSTEIAARLDPEEWREMVAAYHRAAAGVIERFGGRVAQYLGDGVMAYFGWPQAHDNDAEGAIRAGLSVLDEIARLNTNSARPKLSARVGIHTGSVVIGAGVGKEVDVFGEVPNIAARVQAAADVDSVLMTIDTHRLVAGLFVIEERGPQQLKGIERPIGLFRVMRPSGMRGRFEAAAAIRGLTPFVGRDDELRLLMNRWNRVRASEGQIVLIVGEAGIGKSRLIHRFREQMASTPHRWIEGAATPLYQNTPFYPISEVLRNLTWHQSLDRLDKYLKESLGQDNDSTAEAEQPVGDHRIEELQSELTLAGLTPGDSIPLIAPLLDIPVPEKYTTSLSPEKHRQRLLATLVEWFVGVARARPTVIVIEDLHWADASTLELMQLLADQAATAPLMVLFTARPEFRPQWPLRSHHAQIVLNRLGPSEIRTMVQELASRALLAAETVDRVVERTGGVPLFVEELTRAVLENGSAKISGREIPATLHDSLMSRLDRLGPAKEVVQIGAVLGGEFSYELLHAVHPIPETELQRHLRSAIDAELVYARGIAPEASYQFKHALIRDAAYEALLKSRRKELHRLIAQTVDGKFPTLKEKDPEMLAHHWSEAGESAAAIVQWERAGKFAEAGNAVVEAEEHYRRALSLVDDLPPGTERDRRQFELQIALGNVVRSSKKPAMAVS